MNLAEFAILDAKILIVDDQESSVSLLAHMLAGAGYQRVASTTNPRDVCDLHRRNGYDLILLDLQMPGMNGFDVMKMLAAIEPGNYLPVMVITAMPEHNLQALQAGAKDFISKPFQLAEVLIRIHNMLEVRLLHSAACKNVKVQESLAMHDPLTGLANRRLLIDRMSMAMAHARRTHEGMALVYLDLDSFKLINDFLGHEAGDNVLRMVAERLLGNMREADTVARLGGDEFMLVLSQVDGISDTATAVLKVIKAVSQPYGLASQVVSLTTSAGVAVFPDHGEDVDALMRRADAALYEAKRAGKNTFRMAKPAAIVPNENDSEEGVTHA